MFGQYLKQSQPGGRCPPSSSCPHARHGAHSRHAVVHVERSPFSAAGGAASLRSPEWCIFFAVRTADLGCENQRQNRHLAVGAVRSRLPCCGYRSWQDPRQRKTQHRRHHRHRLQSPQQPSRTFSTRTGAVASPCPFVPSLSRAASQGSFGRLCLMKSSSSWRNLQTDGSHGRGCSCCSFISGLQI